MLFLRAACRCRGGEGELGLASGRGMHTISDLGAGEGVQTLGIRDIV
jgi:hypothetical protein